MSLFILREMLKSIELRMNKTLTPSHYHTFLQKRLLDSIVSLATIIGTSPLIFLLIKAVNNGPVLFIQKRVGKDGKIFKLIKFRTMRLGAEKEIKKMKPPQVRPPARREAWGILFF